MSIKAYKISNEQGDIVHIANYGARLLKWITQVDNQARNIILGYEQLENYLNDTCFIGAIVGPYANRIAHSTCTVNGQTLLLDANEGEHHLHGGNQALANLFWECIEHEENKITLKCVLADGYNGYPGEMTVEVSYSLVANSELANNEIAGCELVIDIKVTSDKATIAGPTTHPYFNLGPDNNESRHSLQLLSEYYTPVNNVGLPQGRVSPVAGTQFDYLTPKNISGQTRLDNNFLLVPEDSTLSANTLTSGTLKHAILQSDDEKLKLHVSSNYPAMQVYTGQHLQAPFRTCQGVCLEPQFCPDSPNQSTYPFHLTTKYKPLKTQIVYQLEKVKNK